MAFDLTCLATLKGQFEVGEFLVRRHALGDHLELQSLDGSIVAGLEQETARQHFGHHARRARIGESAGQQDAQIVLARHDLKRLFGGVRRDDDFGEHLDNRLGRFRVQGLVQGHDTAEGADRIAFERLGVGRQSGSCPWRRRHGLACLMIATAGAAAGSNSATSS